MSSETLVRLLVVIIGSGGLGAVIKAYLDYRSADRGHDAAEPKSRAEGESIEVKTAQDVVAFVRGELVTKNAEITALRTRVVSLEAVLRSAGLTVPD